MCFVLFCFVFYFLFLLNLVIVVVGGLVFTFDFIAIQKSTCRYYENDRRETDSSYRNKKKKIINSYGKAFCPVEHILGCLD